MAKANLNGTISNHRLISGLILTLGLSAGAALYADSASDISALADQIRQTDEQLEALKQVIDQNSLLKEELQAAFRQANDKRQERDERLVELDSKITGFDQSLQELELSVKDASKAVAQRKNFLAQSLQQSQRIGVHSTRLEIDAVGQVIDEKTRSVAQLQRDQQRLQTLMEELESRQRDASGYFTALKGQFSLPVSGRVTARFGDAKSVGRLHWQGLFIEASTGAAVHAVADGEVAYADWLQGFGMLVILDHGDGYMTLYGGNRSIIPTTGSWVESGSTIATVGDSGGQHTGGLYFEIRHNATALDPARWLQDTTPRS